MIKFKDPPHPGEVLLEEFLKPMGVSQNAFAKHISVPFRRINEIVNGKRSVSTIRDRVAAIAGDGLRVSQVADYLDILEDVGWIVWR